MQAPTNSLNLIPPEPPLSPNNHFESDEDDNDEDDSKPDLSSLISAVSNEPNFSKLSLSSFHHGISLGNYLKRNHCVFLGGPSIHIEHSQENSTPHQRSPQKRISYSSSLHPNQALTTPRSDLSTARRNDTNNVHHETNKPEQQE